MNYYELLNIGRDADANTVKRAYFSMVKIHSPDRDPEGFKAIRLAYETLFDQKKRSEYDSYFVSIEESGNEGSDRPAARLSGSELQNKLLDARVMIREYKFKQAIEFLSALIGTNQYSEKQLMLFPPEHPAKFYQEAKRLLAEVYWYMKKSGTAQKLCEQILMENPSDAETLLLQAKIAVSAGRFKAADTYFNKAVNASPINARIWTAYMRHAVAHSCKLVTGIFKRAMKQNIDMFRDDYVLYLFGIYKTDLFIYKKNSVYHEKFAEYFLADKNHSEEAYDALMNILPYIIEQEGTIPFVKKILPALETSRHRNEDDEENFRLVHRTFIVHDLVSDKRIHDVLSDMILYFLTENKDKDELLGMEYFIVSNLSDLRPSIKVLKNEYPDFFKLNQEFFIDVLNEKKETYLIDKYNGKFKKAKLSLRKNIFLNDFNDDFSETDEPETFIRSSPKTGRNDPCPCGSGKKYKKCCGK